MFLDMGVDKLLLELVFFSGPALNANLSMLAPNEGNGFCDIAKIGYCLYYIPVARL